MKATFCDVTPLIPGGDDLTATLAFYIDAMHFERTWEHGICRGGVAFNLVRNDNREWASNASFSIGVTDLDALYDEYRDLPAKVGPMEIKPWGRREFHVIVPTGVCFQFYEKR